MGAVLRKSACLLHERLQIAWGEVAAVKMKVAPELDQLVFAGIRLPGSSTAGSALAYRQAHFDPGSLDAHDRTHRDAVSLPNMLLFDNPAGSDFVVHPLDGPERNRNSVHWISSEEVGPSISR
jgi:hypothetical protein